MKNIILLVLFLFAFGAAQAQDQAIFTHYHISPILINPGATGFSEKNHLMMNIRSQWASALLDIQSLRLPLLFERAEQ